MQEAAPLTFASGLANPFVHRLHQSPSVTTPLLPRG
jgi:hypothetical protein